MEFTAKGIYVSNGSFETKDGRKVKTINILINGYKKTFNLADGVEYPSEDLINKEIFVSGVFDYGYIAKQQRTFVNVTVNGISK